jgi:hypothetical protein
MPAPLSDRISDVHRSRLRTCGWPLTLPTQSFQVALDGREALLRACARQMRREPAVESPRPLFGAVQVGHDATSDNFKSKTHARQKPIELLVAQLDLPG